MENAEAEEAERPVKANKVAAAKKAVEAEKAIEAETKKPSCQEARKANTAKAKTRSQS